MKETELQCLSKIDFRILPEKRNRLRVFRVLFLSPGSSHTSLERVTPDTGSSKPTDKDTQKTMPCLGAACTSVCSEIAPRQSQSSMLSLVPICVEMRRPLFLVKSVFFLRAESPTEAAPRQL